MTTAAVAAGPDALAIAAIGAIGAWLGWTMRLWGDALLDAYWSLVRP